MRKWLAGACVSLALVASAGAAQADDGFVVTDVNLRSGPGTVYPPVAVLQAGTPLEIFGCLRDISWCDVDWRGYRGWVAGRYLEYSYRGQRVLVPEYAPSIGLPIVTFDFNDYWGRYYRGRDWYSTYDRWGPPAPRYGGPAYPPPGGPVYGGPGYGPGYGGPGYGGPGYGGPGYGGPGYGGPGYGGPGKPPSGGPGYYPPGKPGWGGKPPPPNAGKPPQQAPRPPRTTEPNTPYTQPGAAPRGYHGRVDSTQEGAGSQQQRCRPNQPCPSQPQ